MARATVRAASTMFEYLVVTLSYLARSKLFPSLNPVLVFVLSVIVIVLRNSVVMLVFRHWPLVPINDALEVFKLKFIVNKSGIKSGIGCQWSAHLFVCSLVKQELAICNMQFVSLTLSLSVSPSQAVSISFSRESV